MALRSRSVARGKSSITLRLVRSQWTHDYDPTIEWTVPLTYSHGFIEDSYSVTRTIDGLPYFLSLTDTAGQEEYRGLWAASNLNSDAFLLVYDITNESSLETLDHFMEMIDMETETRDEKNQRLLKQFYTDYPNIGLDHQPVIGMPPPVKIIAGNKCDLKEARVVSARQGLEWARRRGCGFMETSAWEMVNIEETFALIVRRVVEARKVHREQQLSQLHALRQASYLPSSPRYFSPSHRRTIQPVAHSQTAPLTTEERQESAEHSVHSDSRFQRRSLWRTFTDAFSKRTTMGRPSRRRKSFHPAPSQWEAQAQSRPETLSTSSSKKPDQDISEAAYSNKENKRRQQRHDTVQSKHFRHSERISLPWWKRLCDYR
ncbi:Ras small monomeric GTPase [Arthroderma uncinatum]|uniref:Ras small monomeric GTPase n=1 Tax=Arthroderma uncinatum TaxID=74035 RepID=UPI00144AAF3B|nr:Ras small monomeric GTPase [Arthroderma uncinatum]KAF3479881.1 Ras small monomeric GTPase [Arthroderma uncinatum]